MSDAAWPVQVAIYDRLSDALSVSVFDNVPEDQLAPFVLIGEGTEIPADTKTHHGVEHQVEIQVFSSERGKNEVKTILGAVYGELHRKPISVAGFSATMTQFYSETVFPEPNGYRGVAIYRLYTTQSDDSTA